MRLRVKNMEDANKVARFFDESHIEQEGPNQTWLVVDKVKKRMAVA